jgi:hypothetical protein
LAYLVLKLAVYVLADGPADNKRGVRNDSPFLCLHHAGGNRNRSIKLPVLTLVLSMIFGACHTTVPGIHRQEIDGLGRFEFRVPEVAMKGVVVGAPHGASRSASATLAQAVSDRTGAGFVVTHGSGSNRVGAAQPFARTSPYQTAGKAPVKRGSLFREFEQTVRAISLALKSIFTWSFVAWRLKTTQGGCRSPQAAFLTKS